MTVIAHIHHLLLDHCTRCERDETISKAQRQQYLDRVALLLADSRLQQRTDQQIWNLGWDKPFFAHNNAGAMGPAVERARSAGVFADPEVISSPQFMIDETPGRLVQDAVARGDLTGACAVTSRLARVQAFARALPRISQAVNHFHDYWQAAMLGANELQERAVAIAEIWVLEAGQSAKLKALASPRLVTCSQI